MDNYKIYCYTNKINNWRYIGQTKNSPQHRAGHNGNSYIKENLNPKSFGQAIIDFGWDNFEFSILEENIPTASEADEREIYWISYYHTYIGDPLCQGYNITPGGLFMDRSEIHKLKWLNPNYQQIKSQQSQSLWQDNNYIEKIKKGTKKYWSNEENRKAQSERAKNRGKHSFTTKCRCIETGVIYDSMAEAARENGISNGTIISAICRGKKKSIHGLHWEYVKED